MARHKCVSCSNPLFAQRQRNILKQTLRHSDRYVQCCLQLNSSLWDEAGSCLFWALLPSGSTWVTSMIIIKSKKRKCWVPCCRDDRDLWCSSLWRIQPALTAPTPDPPQTCPQKRKVSAPCNLSQKSQHNTAAHAKLSELEFLEAPCARCKHLLERLLKPNSLEKCCYKMVQTLKAEVNLVWPGLIWLMPTHLTTAKKARFFHF